MPGLWSQLGPCYLLALNLPFCFAIGSEGGVSSALITGKLLTQQWLIVLSAGRGRFLPTPQPFFR